MEQLTVRLEHAWIVLQSYSLTAEQAKRSLNGDTVTLTDEMRLGLVGPVCHHCGEHYLNVGEACSGELAED